MKKILLLVLLFFPMLAFAQECGSTLSPADKKHYLNWVNTVEKAHKASAQKGAVRQVPVKIHIVRDSNKVGGVSAEKARNDIQQANTYFPSSSFNFYQCGSINYIDNNTYHSLIEFSNSSGSNEHKMANANKVSNALNVFYCPNTLLKGSTNYSWATLPDNKHNKNWIIMKSSHADRNGIFSHEVGHWFFLLHTHDTQFGVESVTRNPSESCWDCYHTGDLLCDTPADWNVSGSSHYSSYPNCSYTGSKMDDCDPSTPYAPNPGNIMAYTQGNCRSHFTSDQITRMEAAYDNDRTEIHGNPCSIVSCSPPTKGQLFTNNITPNGARLNSIASSSGIRQFRYRQVGYAWTPAQSTTSNYIDLTGLVPGVEYQWQSKRECSTVLSPWSAYETFGTTCEKPTYLQNYTTVIKPNNANLTCTAPALTRRFRYKKGTSGSWKLTGSTTNTYLTISLLTPETTYYWQSRIECASGWSSWSSNESFKTNCHEPLISQNTTTNITKSTAKLNCSASGTKYEFYYSKSSPSSWKKVTSTSGNRTISGLSSGTNYKWKSRRYCGSWSAWSENDYFTTPCPKPISAQNTTSAIKHNRARLNCTTVGTSRRFRYRMNGGSWKNVSSTTGTYRTITGLIPGTAYQWQSRVMCADIESSWSATESFITTCSAPTSSNNTTTNIGSTSAKMNCAATASTHQFQYKTSGSSAWIGPLISSTGNRTINGLIVGQSYIWQSRRYCNGWSDWSVNEHFTTKCYAPASFQNTTSNITINKAKLNCSASGTRYIFRHRKSNSGNWTSTTSLSSSFTNLTGLSPDTDYEWQSRVKCASIWSNWSGIKTFKTKIACSPPTLANNSTTNVSHNSAKLNCAASGNTYHFRYKKSSSSSWGTPIVSTVNNRTITGLSHNTTYLWQSRRTCSNGYLSKWSGLESFKTTIPVCSKPTGGQNYTSNISYTSVRLHTNATGTSRQFKYRKSGTTNYTTPTSTTSSYKNITGLLINTTYEYRSRRKCSTGIWSSWSTIKTFKTKNCTQPSAGSSNTTNITHNSAKLNTVVSGVRIQFRVKKKIHVSWTTKPASTSKSLTLNNLPSSTDYQWQVRKECASGVWSSWSTTETFKTGLPPCSTPTSAQTYANNIGTTSARLNSSATGTHRQFRYKKSSVTSWTTPTSTTSSYKTITGLVSNTTYHYRSRRKCSSGVWSNWSGIKSFKTNTPPVCSAPTVAQNYVNYIGNTTARLNSSATGTYRQFRYKKASETGWTTPTYTTNSYKYISSLTPNTYYHYRTRRKCTNGVWSSWSTTETFKTNTPVCGAPTTAQNYTTNLTNSSVNLNTSVSGNQFQFRYKKAVDFLWTEITASTSKTLLLPYLAQGTQYEWQTRRACTNGIWSHWSDSDYFTTTNPVCGAPAVYQNTISNITQNSVRLNTNASSVEQQFQFKKVLDYHWTTTAPTTLYYKNIPYLAINTDYEFQVKVKCPNGVWSPWSGSTTFSTLSCTKPIEGGNWTSNLTSSSAQMNTVASGVRFQFQYKKALDLHWSPTTISTNKSVPLPYLATGTKYEWQVRRECVSNVWSGWSEIEEFTTPGSLQDNGGSGNSTEARSTNNQLGSRDNTEDQTLTTEGIQLNLIPNPVIASQRIDLTIEGTENKALITVSSLTGKIVHKQVETELEGQTVVSLPAIQQAGMYLITVQSGNKQATTRLIVLE